MGTTVLLAPWLPPGGWRGLGGNSCPWTGPRSWLFLCSHLQSLSLVRGLSQGPWWPHKFHVNCLGLGGGGESGRRMGGGCLGLWDNWNQAQCPRGWRVVEAASRGFCHQGQCLMTEPQAPPPPQLAVQGPGHRARSDWALSDHVATGLPSDANLHFISEQHLCFCSNIFYSFFELKSQQRR